MGTLEIFLVSFGLAMDAFAVAVCKGLALKEMDWKKAVKVGLYFGIFQAGMALIGFLFGNTFSRIVIQIDHWIAFALLSFIGIEMIKEAFSDSSENCNDDMSIKTMIMLAIATSIDALTVGITFAFFKLNILLVLSSIGGIAFVLSILGVKLGNKFGKKYERKAQIAGGIILIFMGIKILLEHLGFIF